MKYSKYILFAAAVLPAAFTGCSQSEPAKERPIVINMPQQLPERDAMDARADTRTARANFPAESIAEWHV